MLKLLTLLILINSTHEFIIRIAPGSPKEQLPIISKAFQNKKLHNLELENICVHASNLNENEIYVVAHAKCKYGFEVWGRGLGNDLGKACEKCAEDVALLLTLRQSPPLSRD